MALVAYGSSDESASDSEEEHDSQFKQTKPETGSTLTNLAEPVSVNGDNSQKQSSPLERNSPVKKAVDLIEDDEYDVIPTSNNSQSQNPIQSSTGSISLRSLPAPKSSETNDIDVTSFGLVTSDKTKETDKPLDGPVLEDDGISFAVPSDSSGNAGLKSMVYDDELEDVVKPKSYGETLPAASGKKKRQPVKITVPSLPDSDSDSEDEDRSVGAVKKNRSKSKGKSGLFSMLPAPKHVSIKAAGRTLLPHTLKKPPAPSKPVKPKTTNVPAKPILPEALMEGSSSSEDEDEGQTSFFSIGASSSSKTINLKSAPDPGVSHKTEVPLNKTVAITKSFALSKPATDVNKPTLRGPWMGKHEPSTFSDMFPSGSKSNSNTSVKSDSSSRTAESSVAELQDNSIAYLQGQSEASEFTPDDNDAPLEFNTNRPNNPYAGVYNYAAHASGVSMGSSGAGEDYPMQTEDTEEDSSGYQGDHQVQQLLQDDDFLQMSGMNKKRKHEDIHIIDFHADDHLNPADLIKNITQESSMKSHSKKRSDLPSAQQRRKHQITYLAHQAKEQEFELKNAWATNRQTKRETQSKYGF